MDAGTDSGFDAGPPDSGPPDAGPPDSGPPDTGAPDAGICNPDGGIECDGDWAERCTPACAAGQCCSPIRGRFECVDRPDGGACPAADLWIDGSRIEGRYAVEWQFFPEGDCAIAEGCVTAAGWRRLLRFDTWTPNTGTADMYLGPPSMDIPYFTYSMCHDHYHFDSYASYELRNMDGSVAATGHKQAFCLLDYYRYPGTDGSGGHYTCGNQGIQMDWQDVYDRGLDCQWVDVTGVTPGDYTLHIDLNYERLLNESDYTNNTLDVTVSIPMDDSDADPTVPCPAGTGDGTTRQCGLVRDAVYTCTPGEMVRVGCSSRCGLGSCTGDPFIRVCDVTHDPGCSVRWALARNDDSGCGGGRCGAGGDCCSRTPEFACPASGQYVVFYGAYSVGDAITCNVATSP